MTNNNPDLEIASILPITTYLTLTVEDLTDIVSDGIMGGTYWIHDIEIKYPENNPPAKNSDDDERIPSEEFQAGNYLLFFHDNIHSDQSVQTTLLTPDKLVHGIQLYQQKGNYLPLTIDPETGWTRLDSFKTDARICEQILQCALFDDICFS